MWVRQLSDEGDVAWETTFGNRSALPSDFVLTAINLRSDGSMLVTGSTTGTLSDSSNASAGRIDMFLRSINAEGDTEWTEMLGTAEDDLLLDAKFLPGSNRLAIVGTTKGSIGAEPYKGGWDTFLGVLADAA